MENRMGWRVMAYSDGATVCHSPESLAKLAVAPGDTEMEAGSVATCLTCRSVESPQGAT
jgi:hypothetical protein